MTDMRTNAEGDLDMTNLAPSLVEGHEAIAQHLEMRYRSFLGENVYNRSSGCPWLQAILGQPAFIKAVEFILIDYGERTPGIVPGSILLSLQYTDSTRALVVTGTARSDVDLIEFDFEVGLAA